MIVTTSERPPAQTASLAHKLAEELKVEYAPRANKTIRALRQQWSAEEIVVVGPREVKLLSGEQPPFFFHPSMALVRLKRLMAGGADTLLSLSGAAPGDTVVDCTAGLCSDALMFSYAVGPQGKVLALEASDVLHAIVREGLRLYETGLSEVDAAMRSIEPVHGHHRQWLEERGENSADIVYFDPMFDRPIAASSSLVPLRTQACCEALTAEAVQAAVRVARKKVILKDRRDSGQFERLGFERLRVSSSPVAYGVISIGH